MQLQAIIGDRLLTPEEFALAMRTLADRTAFGEEEAHLLADQLMCGLLQRMGYADGIEVFVEMEKWYS